MENIRVLVDNALRECTTNSYVKVGYTLRIILKVYVKVGTSLFCVFLGTYLIKDLELLTLSAIESLSLNVMSKDPLPWSIAKATTWGVVGANTWDSLKNGA